MDLVQDAFESNWIAPLGPHVDAFEQEFCARIGVPHAVALSSCTAALHLALRMLSPSSSSTSASVFSSEVICPTLTFSACANAVAYEGGKPVFIDCEPGTWNIDPGLLREELVACARRGKLPWAVVVVDLYGQSADYDPIVASCSEFSVPLIEDAAEALGATYWGKHEEGFKDSRVQADQCPDPRALERAASDDPGQPSAPRTRFAGSFGKAAAFSFNGNKVITTSGGGMLVSHDKSFVERARFLSTQAQDPAPHYQHSAIGYNYRLSNILAAIGRAQLAVLDERVQARRRNFEFYREALADLPGIEFQPEAPYGRTTRWLTCLTIDPMKAGVTREDVRLALEQENIESRPVMKPMHLQPVFKGCRVRGGRVSESLFENGLCVPSGSAMTEQDLERVCSVVRQRLG